jgi:hypothetical protein
MNHTDNILHFYFYFKKTSIKIKTESQKMMQYQKRRTSTFVDEEKKLVRSQNCKFMKIFIWILLNEGKKIIHKHFSHIIWFFFHSVFVCNQRFKDLPFIEIEDKHKSETNIVCSYYRYKNEMKKKVVVVVVPYEIRFLLLLLLI